MSTNTHLHFTITVGQHKPETIRNPQNPCPFCDRENLTDIEAVDGSILYLKNKYPVLQDTEMMVLIETDQCDGELSRYPKEHLHRLIRFGVARWEEMIATGLYPSVIFYKNHGPLSGGSLNHPHMQIVGLKNLDYHVHIKPEHFAGILIDRQEGVEFNLSTHPRIGFFEFNIVLHDRGKIDSLADYIQSATHYILNYFHKNCTSYNLFFYQIDGKIAAKIVPRMVAPPLFIGYSLPLVSDRSVDIVRELRERYFSPHL